LIDDVRVKAPLGATDQLRDSEVGYRVDDGIVIVSPRGQSGRGTSGRGRHAAVVPPSERHGRRFTIFSAIGGLIFVLGLALQVVLTGWWHFPAFGSYLVQAAVSVELSFVLNRWLTWRDRDTALWTAFARFNAQKTITVALNAALYAGLLHLGMNYLIANIVLTIVFTAVNYAAGDKLVFSPRKARSVEVAVAEPHTVPLPAIKVAGPSVSIVIPCRNNEATIGAAVESLLDQDYAHLEQIIVVGSPDDTTWAGLIDIDDPRLTLIERAAPPGVRDANFKRDAGIKMTSTELVALVDSDIVLPPDWLSTAVTSMRESGVSCVAGGMKSIHDSFWGRYTDNTVIGAKTPRVPASYLVTSDNFGKRGRKPPITANALFSRELYDRCAIDPTWSHGSYEDYEWFWRVATAGFSILVSKDLFGWHHHRRGLGALVREYQRSARGCAYFIRAHLDCPFARRRLWQAVLIPVAVVTGTVAVTIAAAVGESTVVVALMLGCVGLLAAQQILRLRRLEAVAYPVVGLALGVVYTMGLVNHLMRVRRAAAVALAGPAGILAGPAGLLAAPAGLLAAPAALAAPVSAQPAEQAPAPAPALDLEPVPAARPRPRPRRRLLHPLLAICAVQTALSASLIWSNTAFGDEAEYLWIGRLVWAHWLHGTPLPPVAARLSGSSLLYPPIGALADSLGGLAGARILSLAFMLGATILLYCTAARLVSRTGALFAVGLWAVTEPVLRLAFATYDPLSLLFTALSAWLIVQAGIRRHRGELVAAAALALALANATAFSGVVIDPVVVAFAFLTWRTRMGTGQAASAAGWFAGGFAVFMALVMTVTHSWSATTSIYARTSPDHQPVLLVITDVWQFSGLVLIAALMGLAVALGSPDRRQAALLIFLGLSAFLVPVAQLAEQTGWSLDKHLAYGIWFAAIAGGYAAARLVARLPDVRRWAVVACGALALIYPAVNGWESAWNIYHAWANSASFTAALRPAVAGSDGLIDVPGQQYVAQYYLPQGQDWQRWQTQDVALDPPGASGGWPAYYDSRLAGGSYGTFSLFYAASSDTAAQQAAASLRAGRPAEAGETLTRLSGLAGGEPGLPDLTAALQRDSEYRLVAVGPYDTSTLAGNHGYGVYAIWQKVR
jgi:GT2 family glycosyltransferase/putative flippase GtrA